VYDSPVNKDFESGEFLIFMAMDQGYSLLEFDPTWISRCHCFGGTFCRYLQGRSVSSIGKSDDGYRETGVGLGAQSQASLPYICYSSLCSLLFTLKVKAAGSVKHKYLSTKQMESHPENFNRDICCEPKYEVWT
jgi:hypothetical protein